MPTYDHDGEVAWVVTEFADQEWDLEKLSFPFTLFNNTDWSHCDQGITTCVVQEREYKQDPMDVVMLCKEWVHSASLSQEPLMIIPKDYVDILKGVRLQAHPRKELSTRECDECPVVNQ